MGAGFAELFLERNRGGGQAVQDPGNRLDASPEPAPPAKHFHAPGRDEPGRQASAGGEKITGIVSVIDNYLK